MLQLVDLTQVTDIVTGVNATNRNPAQAGNATTSNVGTINSSSKATAATMGFQSPSATAMPPWSFREAPFLPNQSATVVTRATEEEKPLTFLLMGGPDSVLATLSCQNQVQYSEWADGLSMLLDKSITTPDTAEFIHSLTDMGLKFALLDFHAEPCASNCIGLDVQLPDILPDSNYYYTIDT
jgi:engulfment/cell motility protein 1